MEFKRAAIDPQGQSRINVLFNPSQYGIDKSNQIAEIAVPGLEAPILQYVHGNTRSLSMELFFDTYEEQGDVRDHTNRIYGLLRINPETHVPPICKITWGGFSFTGVLDHVSGKFTLFVADGTPVRATLNVVFKEFIPVKVLVQENPTQSADHRKTRAVKAGDRLDLIAVREYGDPGKWRPIADANNLRDPRKLRVGRTLIIPVLTNG
ncbi:MAG: LysM peptidoglycan-binding domain-containing protein [Bryobacteraceae bacterium]